MIQSRIPDVALARRRFRGVSGWVLLSDRSGGGELGSDGHGKLRRLRRALRQLSGRLNGLSGLSKLTELGRLGELVGLLDSRFGRCVRLRVSVLRDSHRR